MSTSTTTRAGVDDLAAALSTRAAVYLRISDDKGGQGLGVERQREDCLALVEARGWRLGDVFEDNDISAYSGKPRPGYLALVEAVRAGAVDVVVAYRPDRLTRRAREIEDLIDLLDETHTDVATVASGGWDLSSTSGRRNARIMGAIAQGESEEIRDKVRRAMVQSAAMGKAHGATRTYGLDGVRVGKGVYEWAIVPPEAAVIVETAERILAGESLLSIVRDLNAREIPAPRGGQWAAQSLRNIVISARVAGWREHKPGRGKDDRAPYEGGEFTAEGEWPAILPRATVERVRRVLVNPSRQHGPRARTYLLSGGLAKCGECGGNLAGQAGNKGRREYRCSVSGGGCGGVQIGADDFEAFIVEETRQGHESGRFDAAVRDASRNAGAALVAHDALVALYTERDEWAAVAAGGGISPREYLPISRGLAVRIAAAEADRDRAQETEATALLVGGAAEFSRAWAEDEAAGNLGKMRARLSAALVRVTVSKGLKGRNRFDEARVDPEWIA